MEMIPSRTRQSLSQELSPEDKAMLEMVAERLKAFGYEVEDADKLSLAFVISKVEQSINNECNAATVPTELQYAAVDMVCGEFLQSKYSIGQLDLAGLDFSSVSSLSEGDVSISFDNDTSDEKKLQSLIGALKTAGKDELLCYRKLRW